VHVEGRSGGAYALTVWSDVGQRTCLLQLTGFARTADDVPAAASAELERAGWRVLHPWIRRGDTWRVVVTGTA
jgi:hypothetical protein